MWICKELGIGDDARKTKEKFELVTDSLYGRKVVFGDISTKKRANGM